MSDRRLTPANGRVAHVSLHGQVAAGRFVTGERARVTTPVADLLTAPGGRRDRQLVFGDGVLVLDRDRDHAFLQAEKDGYCGWLAEAALGPDHPVTHWVSAPATHLYSEADLKRPELACLTLGSLVGVTGTHGRFAALAGGGYAPLVHLRATDDRPSDPAAIAESLLGTPYLWGGNSRQGMDCSGLVQAALLACGLACPGDSDLQEAALGKPVPPGGPWRRNDLFFWKGHVAIATGEDRLIHANGFRMAVTVEPTAECIARIDAAGEGPLRVVKRFA